jgi:carboxyl-terminal processing protease
MAYDRSKKATQSVMRFSIYLCLCVLSLILAACSMPFAAAPSPTPVPAPSATARPASTDAPTARPTLTPTTVPTPTPAPPTPTAAPTVPVVPLDPTATLVPVSGEEREQIFNEAWEIVRDNYLYEDYNGLDWQAVREELAPRAAAAETPEAFYAVMYELINRLNDEHSRFESPQDVARQEAEFEGELRYGGIGAVVRELDDGGLILTLAPGGPAEQAGLQTRDLIIAVDGIPFNDPDAFGPEGPISRIRGTPGSTVVLTVQTAGEAAREVTVTRQAIPGDAFPRVESSRLAGNIGLVTIETFYVEEVDQLVREKVEALLAEGPLNGLIIDVRSNSGGYVHLMRNTLALFIDGGSIGSTGGRTSNEEQIIPDGRTIPGMENVPMVVLTGPDSVSAAEMFAAGMQVRQRARIVGLPSAGNTENLFTYNFDDGSRILLAEVAYRLPDGTLIEGRGVLPDRTVDAEWWRYPPEEDPQITAALDEIAMMRDKRVQAGR